jgi:hypothetical protein
VAIALAGHLRDVGESPIRSKIVISGRKG